MSDLKLISIGNAIVDILSPVEDTLLRSFDLIKGSMTLVNDDQFKKIYSKLDNYQIKSGGSAANTAVGYKSFGGKASFFGTVGEDDFGNSFKKDLEKLEIIFLSSQVQSLDVKTSKSLILVSKDGERTMCTYLGASTFLSLKDLDTSLFNVDNIIYLEGYLFDSSETKASMIELCKIAKNIGLTICLSLSDSFCVERHRDDFLLLIKNYVDILFSNNYEMYMLLNEVENNDLNPEVVNSLVDIALVTYGSKGSKVFQNNSIFHVPSKNNLDIIDTTGAGDLYASGFLFGISKNLSMYDCAKLGTESASYIIQQYGARPISTLKKLL